MSYILDALKKSEKERQRGTVPNVMTAQDVAVQERKKRLLWPYILAGALIINAGVLAWWLTGRPNKPPLSPHPVAVQQLETKTPVRTAGVSDEQSSGTPASSGRAKPVDPHAGTVEGKTASKSGTRTPEVNVSPVGGIPKKQPLPARGTSQSVDEGSHISADAKEAREVTSPPQPSLGDHAAAGSQSADNLAPQPNRLYHLKELPVSIQQTLPDFAISTHLYSLDGASRMARINGQLLREGQYLTAGVKLDEITADGLIFSYRGYRFRIGLK